MTFQNHYSSSEQRLLLGSARPGARRCRKIYLRGCCVAQFLNICHKILTKFSTFSFIVIVSKDRNDQNRHHDNYQPSPTVTSQQPATDLQPHHHYQSSINNHHQASTNTTTHNHLLLDTIPPRWMSTALLTMSLIPCLCSVSKSYRMLFIRPTRARPLLTLVTY